MPSRSGRVVYSAVLAACGMDSHVFEPQTSTNACRHVCRYMDRKGSAAMLTSILSAGVTPEVNLRNSLHAGNKARKRGIHPGFETQGRRYQKSKTGVSVVPQKGLVSSKNFQKKCIITFYIGDVSGIWISSVLRYWQLLLQAVVHCHLRCLKVVNIWTTPVYWKNSNITGISLCNIKCKYTILSSKINTLIVYVWFKI